jgi:hypothetical protein
MKVLWRKSAIQSLLELDKWRATVELPQISPYLKTSFEFYFQSVDYSVYIPGKTVYIKSYPVDLRMVLISVGKSDPYKVFFRLTSRNIEIFLVRHPHQKPLG